MSISTIPVNPNSLTLKPTLVNLKQSKKNIADQYGDLIDGFQREAIQNSWDARNSKDGKDWRIEISYDPNTHNLRVQDFGTTGMTPENWDRFHSLWYTEKDKDITKGGSRGQGKLLYHACGSYIISETVGPDNVYRCRYSTPEGYTDFEDQKPRELNHQGTLVTIYNVEEKIRTRLLDMESFARYVQRTWWEILAQGATIVYRVSAKEKPVKPLIWPQHKPENHRTLDDQMVSRGKESFGILRNLNLYFSDKDVPEDLRGLAINVGGQTIQRYHPPLMGHPLRRFFGYCSADFLRDAENPNHSGFQTSHPAWKSTREVLDLRIKEFVEPLVRSDTHIDPKHKDIANRALDELNETLKQFPDLDPHGTGGSGPTPPPPKKPPVIPTNVYIVSLTCDKQKYLKGDSVKLEMRLKNPTKINKSGYVETLTVRDPTNQEIFSTNASANYQADAEATRAYQFGIPQEAQKGIYYAVAIITDHNKERIAAKTKLIFVETELERHTKQKEEGKNKGSGKGSGQHGPGLAEIRPVRSSKLEKDPTQPSPQAYLDAENGILIVNFSHPTAKYIIKNAKGEALKYHILKCATNELIEYWVKNRIKDLDEQELSVSLMEQMFSETFDMTDNFLGTWARTFIDR